MGVPAFFRWLSDRYPYTISAVREEEPQEVDGEEIPVDISRENPNGEEFDNLYLDMNGIVHPCSHPEDRPAPKNEEEMMHAIFDYTERIINMVRPRKLVMMAVDGVAPRAKMNQQRSRRFRSAQEAQKKEEEKAIFRRDFLKNNKGAVEEEGSEEDDKIWDSNVITPGTPFMDNLALSLRYWTAHKLNTDPAWRNVKVIISDATVPGEGEHKIMEYIRSQRRSPEHDPNTRHVICGLDADLIMLALATHEPHFRILREDVFFQAGKPGACRLCGQQGHIAADCTGKAKARKDDSNEMQGKPTKKPWIWLHVNVLREYLEQELIVSNLDFPFDLERAIDDWLFLCFFVGNDFLPHLPSLEIREEGIDALTAIWKDNLNLMGGYVTQDGIVNLARAQYILNGLAKQEDAIFRNRKIVEDKRDAGRKRRKMMEERNNNRRGNAPNTPTDARRQSGGGGGGGKKQDQLAAPPADFPLFSPADANSREIRDLTHEMFVNRKAMFQQANDSNKSAAAILKEKMMLAKAGPPPAESAEGQAAPEPTSPTVLGKRKASMIDESESSTSAVATPVSTVAIGGDSDETPPDDVRLWEDGYADRYYERKFGVDPKDIEFRHKVGNAYVEGLAWVLRYYMQGCQSWTWYYPYHYAPFAADFVDLEKLDFKFEVGTPFKAFEQLMAVLPARSNHAIPEPFRGLMSDEDSEILDFYPEEFTIDLNGKKFEWQGVALLPFIDEKRLLGAMAKKYPLLSPEDVARNKLGHEDLLFSGSHEMYDDIVKAFYSKKQVSDTYKLQNKLSGGLLGVVQKDEGFMPQTALRSPLSTELEPPVEEDNSMRFVKLESAHFDIVLTCLSVHYIMPQSNKTHKSMLLRGLHMPALALDQSEIDRTRQRANGAGRNFGGAPLRNGGGRYNNGRGRGGRIDYASPNHGQHGGNRGRGNNNYNNHNNNNGYSNQRGGHQQGGGGGGYSQPQHGGYQGGGGGGYNRNGGPPPPQQDWRNQGPPPPPQQWGADGGYGQGGNNNNNNMYQPSHNGGGQQGYNQGYNQGGGQQGRWEQPSPTQQDFRGGGGEQGREPYRQPQGPPYQQSGAYGQQYNNGRGY